MDNRNDQIIRNGKDYIPIKGVSQIIKGVRYLAEDPETHEKQWVGNGEVIYDIKNSKENPFFALSLKTN